MRKATGIVYKTILPYGKKKNLGSMRRNGFADAA